MRTLIMALTVVVVLSGSYAYATIDTVHVSTSTGGSANSSRTLPVNGGLVQGRLRLPIIPDMPHTFTIRGNLVDLCDRVEVTGGLAGIIHTIPKASIAAANVNGKGQIVFVVPALNWTNGNFTVKVRYAVELSGSDDIECNLQPRGLIQYFGWIGPNRPSVTRLPTSPGSYAQYRYHLQKGVPYSLTGVGSVRASGIDGVFGPPMVYDGIANKIFSQPITRVEGTSTSFTVTFTPTLDASFVNPLDDPRVISFASRDVGAIQDGWGGYVYYRSNMNLQEVVVSTPVVPIRPSAVLPRIPPRIP